MAEAESIQTFNVIDQAGLDLLVDAGYEVGSEVTDPTAIILRSHALQPDEVAETVDVVVRAGAGVNNVPTDELTTRGVVVENTPGQNALSVTELVVAGMLVGARNLDQAIRFSSDLTPDTLNTIELAKKRFAGHEIHGQTLAVIGLGAIGVNVANTGHALGMNVLGHDRFIGNDNLHRLQPEVKRVKSLETAIGMADFVSIHVPLLETTRDMVNAEMLTAMKRGAILLNFARGELVVASDIVDALDDGRLGKYVTDFPSIEYLDHPDVVATPHLGASTEEAERNCATAAAKQVDEFIANGTIANSVNFPEVQLRRKPESGARALVLHLDEAGILHAITGQIAARGLNIAGIENGSKKLEGKVGTAATLVDLDQQPGQDVADLTAHIAGLDGVMRVVSVGSVE